MFYVGYVLVKFVDIISIIDNALTSDLSKHVHSPVCILSLLFESKICTSLKHAHKHFCLRVHAPLGTGIWGYKLKFEGATFVSHKLVFIL